jgi:hypothetical protein
MNNATNINTNFLIAILRAMTHEANRVNQRLDDADLDEALSEELGEYAQDLAGATGVLAEAYEMRRKMDTTGQDMAEVGGLLNYFATEEMV